MVDGQRESETSWLDVLLDLKDRGLTEPPKLATGDGSLGFWLALAKVFPSTKQQRCWVHKTANVLDKLPKSQQPAAKAMLHEIWMSCDQRRCNQSVRPVHRDLRRQVAAGRRTAWRRTGRSCWRSTTSPPSTGSTCAPATRSRARSRRCGCGPTAPKGPGSRKAGLAMAFKLAQKAREGLAKAERK